MVPLVVFIGLPPRKFQIKEKSDTGNKLLTHHWNVAVLAPAWSHILKEVEEFGKTNATIPVQVELIK